MINLDYASHTPVDEDVLELFCKTERECAGNPLATHRLGRLAHDVLYRAKEDISAHFCVVGEKISAQSNIQSNEKISAQSGEIIFTSGASEANNLAVKGIARAYAHTGRHILSTCLEHPSVSGALAFLAETGAEVELLKVLPTGQIDLRHLQSVIRNDTVLLCISAVDSEIGAIQPLEEIAAIADGYPNLHLHIDAAQAVGKIPLPRLTKTSTLCFSPHKFYGLNGCGVLVKRTGVVLEPLIHGGSEANGLLYRGGTPSPAMAAACAFALQKAHQNQHEYLRSVTGLRTYLTQNLPAAMQINSPPDGSPYILNLSAPNITGAAFRTALNECGIAVSVKSACSSENAPSRTVFAVTGNKKTALNSWRVSLSHLTTRTELDAFLSAVRKIVNA